MAGDIGEELLDETIDRGLAGRIEERKIGRGLQRAGDPGVGLEICGERAESRAEAEMIEDGRTEFGSEAARAAEGSLD